MVTVLLLRFAPFEDGTAIKLTTSCPPPFKSTNDTPPFPPGVTVKDFQSDVSQGFPNPKPGGQPARFPTIIQIVPVVAR